MKNHKSLLLALVFLLSFSACTKDEVKPQLEDGVSTVIKDLPGDVGNTVGSGKQFENFYFSFSTGAKVDTTKRLSTDWDLAFTKEYNSLVTINSGTAPATPGFGGAGTASMVIVNQAYDQVKIAPADAEFTTNSRSSAGWDPGNGNGWYFYDINTHLAVPVKNRTLIIRTSAGKFAKLELISMYKGAPAVVTDLNWPAPYFTFRYFLQQDGSRNLGTK